MNNGLISLIVLIVITLIILGYFGYSLRTIMHKPEVSDNFSYIWSGLEWVWNTFLVIPASFIWNKIIVGVLWRPISFAIEMLNRAQY